MRQWALKFGQDFANRIRRRLPRTGDKWHLDEVVLKIAGRKHWLLASRGSDRCGAPTPTHKQAAKRLLRKLLKRQMRPPRVMITDKLASYGAAKREIMPGVEQQPTLLGILAFCAVDERRALNLGLSLLMLEARHQTG